MSIIKNDTVSKMIIPVLVLNNTESINDKELKNKNDAIIKNDTVSKMITEDASEPPEEPQWSDAVFTEDPGKKNIFTLYEEEIGPLTPFVADALKDAEKDFPETWVVEAIRIAVEMNKRRWKYVEGILNNWKRDGFVPRSMNAKSVSGKTQPGDAAGEDSQRGAPPSDADLETAERILQMQSM
jgi:DnaD/phage-associated family protein